MVGREEEENVVVGMEAIVGEKRREEGEERGFVGLGLGLDECVVCTFEYFEF